MRPTPRNVLLASVVVLAGAWGFVRISAVGAQEALQSAKSARGGLLAKTARHQFEVFFYPTGVRVFPRPRRGSRSTRRGRAGPRRSTTRTRPSRGSPGRSAARLRRALNSPSASGTHPATGGESDVRDLRPRRPGRVLGKLHRPAGIRRDPPTAARPRPTRHRHEAGPRRFPATSTAPATRATATIPTAAPPPPLAPGECIPGLQQPEPALPRRRGLRRGRPPRLDHRAGFALAKPWLRPMD